ncbi:MAG: hypothetical protein KF856_17935 [Cyclobacteriaceae bacterium]|nr:hypothetical protein [Cyclobacteriaceae bacterium]
MIQKKSPAQKAGLDHSSRLNLTLTGCSSAEPVSVSVQQCKIQISNLYLQPVKILSHLPKDFDPKEYKRDILVMNLRKDKIMCVLPTGMSIKNNTQILEGNYTDGRRIINFNDLADIKAKEEKLKLTIKEWLDLIER